MTEMGKKFMETVSNDKALQEKLKEAKLEAVIRIANDNGFKITKADLALDQDELNDDELKAVSGGRKYNCQCEKLGSGEVIQWS